MSVADYGAQQWAGMMFGIVSPPADFYVALCTASPSPGWDGSVLATIEPQGSSTYAREPLANPGGWTLSDGNYVINAAEVAFPTPDIDWGQIGFFALLDAATGGNLWAYGRLLEAVYVAAGYPPTFPVASLSFGVTNLLATIAA